MVIKIKITVMVVALSLFGAFFLLTIPTTADHGTGIPDCFASPTYSGGQAHGNNPHGTGVEAYAYAGSEWMIQGFENASDEPDYDNYTASASIFVTADFPFLYSWRTYGYSSLWNNGKATPFSESECEWGRIPISPDWQDKFENLPQWVQVRVHETGCASDEEKAYAFLGSVYYDTATGTTFLKQSNSVVNLTATPMLDSTAQVLSASSLPQSVITAEIDIRAYGSDWGCRAEMRL